MFRVIKILALTLSLFTTAVLASEAPQISQQSLLAALNSPQNSIVLLDVRTKAEYNAGHVAGAINISHDTIEENLAQLAQHKNSNIVIYCRSGRRTAIAIDVLAKNGFSNLQHLTGDMNGWLEAKLPVVSVK
ncbi:rhodanese-like domain-containing protein [Colwellia sp. 4_MG-2023]|jgi:rhodanese-related sulfurtransferase|uniref:rhodanese-like domain-containing protein n=1 Tax=unclassified Colwellia TaxID=196834 RepID=UPI001C098A3D|nr:MULTISPECIES: rhodanese-like domain-containing protein [unclassified Colwellia]MBU2925488.1 rhodanese-like domain-containing protein [Colwellia sp. C2M11]MDO6506446.1 rhodanese-like domain-containing protein [Colwellia sp. 5_MG-2023]MDO6555270.1 rhodanese-like domain-containing protein [Colwellia sp. 4_MG-2023]MDO6651544.1 rhodanese-like domain-containing protein [Colwellia sp. 3_MG-2023]MDO6665058.1 rhodanese-like domain-containing protein [Colwellia sp. 2_MG-2023]